MTNLVPFSFESHEVRVIDQDGELWFVAVDVCAALGLDPTAIRKLDDDERGLHSVQTLGGMQELSVINESGLYTLILRCRNATNHGTVPHRFRKWVTAEVLPSLRKTGQYAVPAFRLEPKDTPPTRRRTDIPPVAALRLSPLAMQAAKAFGFAGNMAALAADRAIREITGLSPLKLLGHEHLEADSRGKTYTQTELGQMMDPPRSGIAVGKLMADAGLRAKDETGEWIPTAAANGLYEWSDTAKRHNGGTPVKQAKWFRDVLSRLNGGVQ